MIPSIRGIDGNQTKVRLDFSLLLFPIYIKNEGAYHECLPAQSTYFIFHLIIYHLL